MLDIDKTEYVIRKLFKFGIIGVVVAIPLLILNPIVTVGTGERGVVAHFGKVQNEVLDEGIHLVMPIITKVNPISVRVQKSDLKTQASSKDLQLITTEVAINWHIDPLEVNKVYQNVGGIDVIVERILTPSVSEVFKSGSSKLTAEEIITKRNELSQEVKGTMKSRLAKYGVVMDDLNIVDVNFSKDFSHAVEQKQVAEQAAKTAHYVADKAKQDAEAAVNLARGQAESQKLMKTSITPEILQKMAIEKWDGSFPQVMGGGSLPFLNIKLKDGK